MTELTVLCGLPCSGKSTFARNNLENYNAVVVESDKYREKNYGDASIQLDNKALFDEIHKDIISLLSEGKNVILDATNLSYKHRKALLQKISHLNVHKICILFATEFSICLERNKNRERQVPENVLKRMRENFNVPLWTEGWDSIEIEYEFNENNYEINKFIDMAHNFNQDNPHHSLKLGEHSMLVYEYMMDNNVDSHIALAGLFHDVGKIYTKVFTTMKGERSETAHYYNHENVSCYESLFYLANECTKTREILFATALVNYHMRPHMAKSDKAKKKLEETVGSDLYYFLNILHDADVRAH